MLKLSLETLREQKSNGDVKVRREEIKMLGRARGEKQRKVTAEYNLTDEHGFRYASAINFFLKLH